MKLALIGYGKMGKAVEKIALTRGHTITLIICRENLDEFNAANLDQCDVAIEFTNPENGLGNVVKLLEHGVRTVSGTTGWDISIAKELCLKNKGAFIHATNFSLGVNLFFEVNDHLSRLMSKYADYDVSMKEIHHTSKKDAPSGTAITLAEALLKNIKSKDHWVLGDSKNDSELSITSERVDPAPGTHIITYTSPIDEIEISHTAKSREGFAYGAVLAAEWLADKHGCFTMKNVLFD